MRIVEAPIQWNYYLTSGLLSVYKYKKQMTLNQHEMMSDQCNNSLKT